MVKRTRIKIAYIRIYDDISLKINVISKKNQLNVVQLDILQISDIVIKFKINNNINSLNNETTTKKLNKTKTVTRLVTKHK